jgi:hypothetical protein
VTKPRPPLTLDAALARIAGQLPQGWAGVAAVAGRAESTVRRWGDQDQPEQLPMPAAIDLDLAYQRAGGEGAPIFETYALLLQVSQEQAFADGLALQRAGCELAREAGQGVEALVLAGMPGGDQARRDRAIAELEDVARLIPRAIAQLRAPQAPP